MYSFLFSMFVSSAILTPLMYGFRFNPVNTHFIQTCHNGLKMIDNGDIIDVIEPLMVVEDKSKIVESSRKAQWFPIGNMKSPAILDGRLAGDVGFDPLGFSKSNKTLYWMREAELKHGRLAMLAAIGWPLSELWHKPIAEFMQLDSILASGDRAPSILNGGLSSIYASGMLMASIAIAGILEGKSMNSGEVFWNAEKSEHYKPGDLGFDPLSLYTKRNEDKKDMELAEIKNGRLAMVAISAYVAQEVVTGLPVVQQTPYLF